MMVSIKTIQPCNSQQLELILAYIWVQCRVILSLSFHFFDEAAEVEAFEETLPSAVAKAIMSGSFLYIVRSLSYP